MDEVDRGKQDKCALGSIEALFSPAKMSMMTEWKCELDGGYIEKRLY